MRIDQTSISNKQSINKKEWEKIYKNHLANQLEW